MAFTHFFTGGKVINDDFRYTDSNYLAFIEDDRLVIAHSGIIGYRTIYAGDYLGAAECLETLKHKDPKLYKDIEKYFSNYAPDTILYCGGRCATVGELKPGDKFKRDDTEYIMVDLMPSDWFLSQPFSNFVFALNLSTYKVVGLEKTWEVRLIK